jgi:hypothetical protein
MEHNVHVFLLFANGFSVHTDHIYIRISGLTQLAYFAVTGHPPLFDPAFSLAARGKPSVRQDLLNTGRHPRPSFMYITAKAVIK